MVDRVEKILRKLDAEKRDVYENLIAQILTGRFDHLDLVKLKGRKDVFRVRKGSYRIIFRRDTQGTVTILDFERRSESTYDHF